MTLVLPTRQQQRASSEAAILDAAVMLYGRAGPDGVSIRDVAESAGVTHPLVIRYFGSKDGLVAAVGERVTAHVRSLADAIGPPSSDHFFDMLQIARRESAITRLMVRCALGDLRPQGFPACLGGPWPDSDGRNDRRSRVRQYAASSLVLGWLTFDRFLQAGTGLDRMGDRRLDQVVADAAACLWRLGAVAEPALEPRRRSVATSVRHPPRREGPADEALLASAVELFARFGPASVSIRDVARHAQVNHGLVHRHFGSKHDLIARAIEVGVSPLLPGAQAPAGFDIDLVVRQVHRDPTASKLIARTLVDDIAIESVRHSCPVMQGLVDVARPVPAERRPGSLADPRLAAAVVGALVGGSVIWGASLRAAIGIRGDLESAMADLCRQLLGIAAPAGPSP